MITSTPILSGVGTGSPQTVTVPAGQGWTINASNFYNTTGGALSVTVIANDGTDRTINVKSIAGNTQYQDPGLQGLALKAGQVLSINAAVGIDFWVSAIIAS